MRHMPWVSRVHVPIIPRLRSACSPSFEEVLSAPLVSVKAWERECYTEFSLVRQSLSSRPLLLAAIGQC